MDPSLFRVDWEVLVEFLVVVIALSFLVEHTLSFIFEHRLLVAHLHKSALNERTAVLLRFVDVRYRIFDSVSYGLGRLVAGSSSASIKVFRNILDGGGKLTDGLARSLEKVTNH